MRSVDCTHRRAGGAARLGVAAPGWLVRTAHRADDGTEQHGTATSSATCPLGRLSPSQILGVVRGHWGIEKRLQLDAGHGAPRGRHADVYARQRDADAGVLRLLAYNLQPWPVANICGPKPQAPAEAAPQRSWREVLRAFSKR